MKAYYIIEFPKSIPAIADVHWFHDPINAFVIHRINVPVQHRAKGYGSTLLKQICADADAEQVPLILAPEPSGGLPYEELVSWYMRHGFEWTSSGAMMERKPR